MERLDFLIPALFVTACSALIGSIFTLLAWIAFACDPDNKIWWRIPLGDICVGGIVISGLDRVLTIAQRPFRIGSFIRSVVVVRFGFRFCVCFSQPISCNKILRAGKGNVAGWFGRPLLGKCARLYRVPLFAE
jgi:hypothetical protein